MLDMWRKAAASLPAAEVLRAVDVLARPSFACGRPRGALMTELALIKLTA